MSLEIFHTLNDGSVMVELSTGGGTSRHEIYTSEDEYYSRLTTEDLPSDMQYQPPKPFEDVSTLEFLLGLRLAIHNRRLWITHKDFDFKN